MSMRVSVRSVSLPVQLGRFLLMGMLALVAVSNIVFPIIEQRWQHFLFGEPPIDVTMSSWGQDGLMVTSVLLLFVARALARGKRQAWLLSVLLFTSSLLEALTERAHWFSIAMTSSTLILLLVFAPLFSVRSDTRSFIRGYGTLLLGGICLSSYGVAVHMLARGQMFFSLFSRHDVLVGLRVACFLILWYGVSSVLRPVNVELQLQHQEHLRARLVIRRYGHLALAHFMLSGDKRYFWSETGYSLIAYRVLYGVATVLSDPIGPSEEHASLVSAFLAFCQQQDWSVTFYQASAHMRDLGLPASLHAYKIGEEAVVDVERFTLQGKIGAPIRHAIARAKRGEITVACWHQSELPADVFAQLQYLSAHWMQEQKIQSQFRFSMGSFPESWSPDLLTVVAFGAQGEVQAFLTWTPLYAGDGWALDVMRRVKETVPGTMEYVIAESIAWAKARGYKHMSLGLAPLAGLLTSCAHTTSPSLVERSAAYLHEQGALLGQYRSLYAFKAKFQPEWEERYLLVSERQSLPRILFALAQAHGCGIRYLLHTCGGAIISLWRAFSLWMHELLLLVLFRSSTKVAQRVDD